VAFGRNDKDGPAAPGGRGSYYIQRVMG